MPRLRRSLSPLDKSLLRLRWFVLDLSSAAGKLSSVRACVIFNPAAKGHKAQRFRRALDRLAREVTLRQTAAPGDARRLAAQATQEGFDTIIAAGGDGTVNEVLNGIGTVPDGFTHARLGVLPVGTVNVLARELGIPLRLEAAWAALLAEKERRIDLPCFTYDTAAGRQQLYFVQLAGAGLDSRALELVSLALKQKIGALAYVVAGLRALTNHPGPLTVTDAAHNLTGDLILIGNGRKYGGNFDLFPAANLSSGRLDVCVFPKAGWWILLRCGLSLLLANRLPEDAVIRFQSTSFQLTSPQPLHFEVDGELAARLPARVTIEPGGLRILAV